ncbi:hypothetical protein HanPI659440_Chr04g0171571 [Helianthus annuus]|nr:hypothetical protein HanPI659440_Chr04g0171571 [Helianthus annuus]
MASLKVATLKWYGLKCCVSYTSVGLYPRSTAKTLGRSQGSSAGFMRIRATLTAHGNASVQMATVCSQSACVRFCPTKFHDEQSCANKRGQQLSRTRATDLS